MCTSQFGQFLLPAQGCSNAGLFVGGNGHAVTAATDQDTKGRLLIGNCFGNGMCHIGIIHRVGTKGTMVFYFPSLIAKQCNDLFFVLKTCMIASDGYGQTLVKLSRHKGGFINSTAALAWHVVYRYAR